MFIDFRGKGRQGMRERERKEHQYERETSIGYFLYLVRWGIEPKTLIYALTRNQTCSLMVLRMTL